MDPHSKINHQSSIEISSKAGVFKHAEMMLKWHSILSKMKRTRLKKWMDECVDTFIEMDRKDQLIIGMITALSLDTNPSQTISDKLEDKYIENSPFKQPPSSNLLKLPSDLIFSINQYLPLMDLLGVAHARGICTDMRKIQGVYVILRMM